MRSIRDSGGEDEKPTSKAWRTLGIMQLVRLQQRQAQLPPIAEVQPHQSLPVSARQAACRKRHCVGCAQEGQWREQESIKCRHGNECVLACPPACQTHAMHTQPRHPPHDVVRDLMQHGAQHMLIGEEIGLSPCRAQPHTNFARAAAAPTDIQALPGKRAVGRRHEEAKISCISARQAGAGPHKPCCAGTALTAAPT